MKSITDMFFEGSKRIFLKVNRVDHVEPVVNSVVRQGILHWALQLFEVLLLPDVL